MRTITIDLKDHRLPDLDLANRIGRYQTFEAQAGRVHHLEQLLADLRRITRRDLALAHDAGERGAREGSLQLLARLNDTRLGGRDIALPIVAPDLGVFELLG